MVIWLGAGPSRQCLCSPASPPAVGARRLVGPAGCRPLGRQAGPTAWGSCRWLVTVALPLMTRPLSRKAWPQCRRLAGSHCSLTSSCLLNDAHTSRMGNSRLLGAGYAPGRSEAAWPPSSISLAEGAHRPRAVLALVVGGVMDNMATVPRRMGDGRPIRRTVATRAPGFGGWQVVL